jgi:hypothetical protein
MLLLLLLQYYKHRKKMTLIGLQAWFVNRATIFRNSRFLWIVKNEAL